MFFSEENNVLISCVLPVVHGLITKIDVVHDDSSYIKELATSFCSIKTKMSINLNSKILMLASAIDPWF